MRIIRNQKPLTNDSLGFTVRNSDRSVSSIYIYHLGISDLYTF
jgi:hypothetical protein